MVEDPNAIRQRFAHALLSPLTVILGSVEMLVNQAAEWPEYARELLQLALAQGQRLQGTLNDLIASAQVEDGVVRVSWVRPGPPQPPVTPPNTTEKS